MQNVFLLWPPLPFYVYQLFSYFSNWRPMGQVQESVAELLIATYHLSSIEYEQAITCLRPS